MLSLNRLLFPRLVHQGEAPLKDSKLPLYTLDWNPIDKTRRDRYVKSIVDEVKGIPIDKLYPFTTMPPPYNKWIKGLFFVIPHNYMEEIRRCARLGVIEWSTARPFDTMIKGICLEPAIDYIFVAFRLLADCVYDKKTEYYYRGKDKIFIAQALLYKFWSFQTGSGLIKDHAQFKRLECYRNVGLDTPELEEFIKAINKHEKEIFKMIKNKSTETVEEKDEIADFFNPDKSNKTLQIPNTITQSIPISEDESVTVRLKNITLYNHTSSYPYFVHRYEMTATTFMDNPEDLNGSYQSFNLKKLYKSNIAFKLKGVKVKGYSTISEIDKGDSDETVRIRMYVGVIETSPMEDIERKEIPVVKKIDLERADNLVLEELKNKVIKKKGRLRIRSVMDDVLMVQESTPVKDISESKIVAASTPDEDEYPDDLKDGFDYNMLKGPPPKEEPFFVDPKNVKPWPTDGSPEA